jgi:hypothetical protein
MQTQQLELNMENAQLIHGDQAQGRGLPLPLCPQPTMMGMPLQRRPSQVQQQQQQQQVRHFIAFVFSGFILFF